MSTLRTATISNAGGTKSVPTDTVVDGTAKAWVSFTPNGVSIPVIRSAFNVSTVTYVSGGKYQVNFTNSLGTTQYAVTGSAANDGAFRCDIDFISSDQLATASSCTITRTTDNTLTNGSNLVSIIFYKV